MKFFQGFFEIIRGGVVLYEFFASGKIQKQNRYSTFTRTVSESLDFVFVFPHWQKVSTKRLPRQ
jgi:hypothetical protein